MPVLNMPREVADDRTTHRTRLRPAPLLVLKVRRPPMSPTAVSSASASAATAPTAGAPVRPLRPSSALRAVLVLARRPTLMVLPPLVLPPLPPLLLLTGT